ncbi:hypothetical protein EVAR_78736_1 [Eumeta japonica]|uniref:Uncharacterized protein n=1 Tax=Eumeta variegata TaxID=151549 RepID=A0A4C1T183_EUMVA|nr:hypothetical protein EVAR_78736_1 [Eumeta japonica]
MKKKEYRLSHARASRDCIRLRQSGRLRRRRGASVMRYSTRNQPPSWVPRPYAILNFIHRSFEKAKVHVNATRRDIE